MFIDVSLTILSYYLITLLCGIGFFVWFIKLLPEHPLPAYVLSKVFGPVFVSYLIFILTTLHITPYTPQVLWLVLICVLLVAFHMGRKGIPISRSKIWELCKLESVTFVLFVLFTVFRMFGNYNFGSESYMNFGIYNALHRGEYLPPNDMWLSGESLNYYYFGHFTGVVFSKLSFLTPELSYTLNLSWLFIMTVLLVYMITHVLTKSRLAGFVSVLVTFSGNLYYLYEFIINPNSSIKVLGNETRLYQSIPMEHPAYSFFLTDQHANVYSLPIVLSIILLLISLKHVVKARVIVSYALIGFLLGILYMTNGWDFYIVTYLSLMYLGFTYFFDRSVNISGLLLLLGTPHLVTYLYKLSFDIPVSDVNFGFHTAALAILINFGPFLTVFAGFIFYLLVITKGNLMQTFRSVLERCNKDILFLILIGISLILIPTFIYPVGTYTLTTFELGNTADVSRFNMYLKLWYIAWFIFSISTGALLLPFINWLALRPGKRKVYRVLLLLISSTFFFIYPGYLLSSRILGASSDNLAFTLDGTEQLKTVSPDHYYAISYLKSISIETGNIVLIEAPGEAYKEFSSIFSSYTGLPTVIGWWNHEIVWNNNIDEIYKRVEDVNYIYTGESPAKVLALLRKHHVSHLIVSSSEIDMYGDNAGTIAMFLGTKVFTSATVEIYEFSDLISSN